MLPYSVISLSTQNTGLTAVAALILSVNNIGTANGVMVPDPPFLAIICAGVSVVASPHLPTFTSAVVPSIGAAKLI